MYAVSDRFHTLAIQDAPITRCRIYFIGDGVDCTDDDDVMTNGTLLVNEVGDTDSNGRISQDGVVFNEYFNPDKNITLGSCVSSQIGMTLLNFDGEMSNYTFGRCKVYLDVRDDANSTWLTCPMGVYIIDQPTQTKDKLISVTGYDQMQKLDAVADDWWNGLDWSNGLSFIEIINSMATELGVSVSSTTSASLANGQANFDSPPTDCVNKTFRDILSLIGEANGAIARFDRDGALDMRFFDLAKIDGNTVTINTDKIGNQCFEISVAEYFVAQYGDLQCWTGQSSSSSLKTTETTPRNKYTIRDNAFLNIVTKSITGVLLIYILNKLWAIKRYKPIRGSFIMDWSIESGDIIQIIRNGTTYLCPIFQQSMAWRGGFVKSELFSDGDILRPESATKDNSDFPAYSEATRQTEGKTENVAGWYRAIKLALGSLSRGDISFVLDINMLRTAQYYTESHTIQYRSEYIGNGFFTNETSAAYSGLGIDKIRYTYSSNAGYIDIHTTISSPIGIAIYFTSYCETQYQAAISAQKLSLVSDTPTGETIQSEYAFLQNGNVITKQATFKDGIQLGSTTLSEAQLQSLLAMI